MGQVLHLGDAITGGAGRLLFLELGTTYIGVLTLLKFIKVYKWNMCVICVLYINKIWWKHSVATKWHHLFITAALLSHTMQHSHDYFEALCATFPPQKFQLEGTLDKVNQFQWVPRERRKTSTGAGPLVSSEGTWRNQGREHFLPGHLRVLNCLPPHLAFQDQRGALPGSKPTRGFWGQCTTGNVSWDSPRLDREGYAGARTCVSHSLSMAES